MKKFKIGDLVVISVILLITAGVFCFRFFCCDDGQAVCISVDGNEEIYSLEKDRTLEIENGGVSLKVVIEKGSVFVADSNCPEKTCLNMGRISKYGDTIACVPAKVLVKIISGEEAEYDYVIG